MSGKISLFYGPNLSFLREKFITDNLKILRDHHAYIYLAPHNHRVLQLVNRFLQNNRNGLVQSGPFRTPSDFFKRLHEKLNLPAILLPFVQRLLLLKQIANYRRENLKYFENKESGIPNGILTSLVHFFDEVRLNGNDKILLSNQQNELLQSAGSRLGMDLSLLFSEYCTLLGEMFLDPAGLMDLITEEITSEDLSRMNPGLEYLIWEDASDFKIKHIRLIEKFKSLGVQVFLILPYGENPEIFAPRVKVFRRLKDISEESFSVPDKRKLSLSLFQMREEKVDLSEKIKINPEVDRISEVESAAASLKKIAIDYDLSFSGIVLSSPQPETYRPLIETVFKRYHIPHTFADEKKLNQSLPVQHLLLFLELVTENYPLDVLQQILQSPFFEYRLRLRDNNIRQILEQLRVRNEKKDILDQIEKYKNFLNENAGENKEEEKEWLEKFDNLVTVLDQIFEETRWFEEKHTASEYYNRISQLLKDQKTIKRLFAEITTDYRQPLEDHLSALRQFYEVLNQWIYFTEISFPNRRYSTTEFLDLLRFLTETSGYQVKRPQRYGVQIIPFRDLKSIEAEAVFILGMEDGVFPVKRRLIFAHPQIMPDELQSLLPFDPQFEDRELFYYTLNIPAKAIRFFYPRYHRENPVLPSAFLRELHRISLDSPEHINNLKLYTSSYILEKIIPFPGNGGGDKDTFEWDALPPTVKGMIDREQLSLLDYRKRVLSERQNFHKTSQWGGIIGSNENILSLVQKIYRNSQYSSSQLETYASCPMIYFFERVLRLLPQEEIEEGLGPRLKGELVHRILYRYFRRLAPAKRELPQLLEIAKQEIEKLPFPKTILWQTEQEFLLGSPGNKGLLAALFDYEKEISSLYTTAPQHFELAFGSIRGLSEEVDPHSSQEPFIFRKEGEEFFLKGKIDRIEIGGDGALLVVDYKTGSIPALTEMWEGQKLQLPVYLAAAFDLLKGHYPRLNMAGGVFYSLKSELEIKKSVAFLDENGDIGQADIGKNAVLPNRIFRTGNKPVDLAGFIDRILNYSAQYILSISQGQFPHTTDPSNCRRWDGRFCEYLPVCKLNRLKQAYLKKKTE